PLRDARAALEAAADDLEVPVEAAAPRAGLLDQWDPLLVGWRSRESLLEHYPRKATGEAHYRPFAYVRARAVAVWSLRQGTVSIGEPFTRLTKAERAALGADAADVERFFASSSSG
ncbi:MAG TPA: crosslink repair DNA glycosylase YcaQ family protein, partial [Solirubrobacterales bacterium]|nr:crosslink repair DNA glycosylase YcaQ family protein [Solirubrobacterales bacterium]